MKIEDLFDKYFIYVICFLIVLSLFSSSDYSIFINNLVPIRIISPLFSLSVIGFYIYKNGFKEFTKKEDSLAFALGFFLLVQLYAGIISTESAKALGYLFFWINISFMYMAFYLISKYISNHKKVVFYTYGLLGLLTTIIALIKTCARYFETDILIWGYEGRYRISNIISDENHYAFFIIIITFIALGFLFTYFDKLNTFKKILLIIFILLLTFILMGSQSRSGAVSFIIGLLFFNLGLIYKNGFKHLQSYYAMTILLLMSIVFVVGFKFFATFNNINLSNDVLGENISIVSDVNQPMDTVDDENVEMIDSLPSFLNEASVKAHLVLIYSAFKIGVNNPFGIGLGEFHNYMLKDGYINLYAKYDPQAASGDNFPTHSMYGNAFAETGVIGLASYLSVIIIILYKYIKSFLKSKNSTDSMMPLAFVSIMIAYMLFTVFYNLHEEFFWLPALLCLSLTTSKSNK